jgi:thiamine-phosphate pyrophosphorylase
MTAVSRMLDASANRAREALRVMEDAARFALNDPALCGDLKRLRHELRAVLESLPGRPPGAIEASRDTPGDVGTGISTAAEQERGGLPDLASAAGKRLSEALRAIEECAKLFDAHAAAAIEQLRYRGYDLEQRLALRLGSRRARQWSVCVLLTESLCLRPWREVARESIRAGADCIQVREKSMPDGVLLRRVREMIELARTDGVSVMVNDRVDIALIADADGVHLGTEDLPIRDARRLAGRSLIIGASTHDPVEAAAAVEAGADYCGVGPMFSSSLKPARPVSGPAFLRAFMERHPRIPHLAIGGISTANVHHLVAAGARGVAVCTAVCGAADPGAAVAALRAAVDAAAASEARVLG